VNNKPDETDPAATVTAEVFGEVLLVTIDRPEARNAVDGPTATALADAFDAYEADDNLSVAVLCGAEGTFCAGADLKAISTGRGNRVERDQTERGPMGPTRMDLSKPVIAAVEGFAVAGGLELALWCDLRVAARDATFGVYCRRWGVPLIDGGTVRLPRLIGHSRAMDLILTGRGVGGEEAERIGLANRVCEPGTAVETALELARHIAGFPQLCLRSDRQSAIAAWGLDDQEAMSFETEVGLETIMSGETREGAARFAEGEGRGGEGV
jgi:enoyl-CoA hydratase